jgi:hypothetical protein
MVRGDDCMSCCVAYVTETDVAEVPDIRLDERLAARDPAEEITRDAWQLLDAWLHGRGLRFQFHDELPLHAERWIGIAKLTPKARAIGIAALKAMGRPAWSGQAESFADHAVVLAKDTVIWDPAEAINPPEGMKLKHWRLREIVHGVTIEKEE